jgi:uncharacterized protein YegJ (DUF2314 family)
MDNQLTNIVYGVVPNRKKKSISCMLYYKESKWYGLFIVNCIVKGKHCEF